MRLALTRCSSAGEHAVSRLDEPVRRECDRDRACRGQESQNQIVHLQVHGRLPLPRRAFPARRGHRCPRWLRDEFVLRDGMIDSTGRQIVMSRS